MYAKTSAQHSRRTPLSLSGATSKQNSFLPRPAGNLNDGVSNIKNDKTTTSQKSDQAAATQSINNKPNRQASSSDKKVQQSAAKPTFAPEKCIVSIKKQEKNDEKKPQNGIGNNNNNGKEKALNGKEANAGDSLKEKKDNKEILTAVEKKEKLEKDNEKKKPLQKQENKERKVEAQKKEEDRNEISSVEKEKSIDKEKQKELKQENKQEKEEVAKGLVETKKKEQEQDKELLKEEVATIEKKDEIQQQPISAQPQGTSSETVEKFAGENTESRTDPTSIRNVDESLTHKDQALQDVAPTTAAADNSDQKRSSLTSNQTISTSTTITIKSTTTTIDDDIEMESLSAEEEETTPKKTEPVVEKQSPVPMLPPQPIGAPPTATSTPGKFLNFREMFSTGSPKVTHVQQKYDNQPSDNCVKYPQSFTQISGRRSIRPSTDSYTPSYFQSNMLCRESYRRINTELDVSSTTNTSLNVTVGSEVPNNSSFSFFGRGRKRELTPPKPESRDPEVEISLKSPKRARIDMQGIFSVVASPLTLLRSRFSKATIQSSTPAKKLSAGDAEDEGEVQNVSGASVEENVEHAASANDSFATEDVTVGKNDEHEKDLSQESSSSAERGSDMDGMDVDGNVVEEKILLKKCSAEEVIETKCAEQSTGNEGINSETREIEQCGAPAKNKRCSIM